MKQMTPLIRECLDVLLRNMEVRSINNYPMDVKKYFSAYTMDVICSCIFGTKINSLQNPESELVKYSLKFAENTSLSGTIAFLFPSMARLNKIPLNVSPFDYNALKFLSTFLTQVYENRQNDPNLRRMDFVNAVLDAMKESGGTLSMREIVEQGIIFFMAGYDTMTATLATAGYALATNPAVQEKLYNEFESEEVDPDNYDYDTIGSLKYLDAFVSEVLRFYTPVPRIERKAIEDCYLGDIPIQKDTIVIIPVHAIHHDPEYFPNPEKFNPERFLNQEAEYVNPYSFLPFASG